jgi:hypothetical protein
LNSKKPADCGPQQHKKLIKKCDFLIFNYEYYCQNLVFIVKKNTKFDQETVALLCVKNQDWGPLTANLILSNKEKFLKASAL